MDPDRSAIILAAGKGTRMKSRLPKVLHKVCGKEMLRHVVDTTRSAGFGRIVIVVSPENEAPIRAALGATVEYVVQREQLGTGHALLQARDLLEGVPSVTLLYGDDPLLLPATLETLHSRRIETGAAVAMLAAELSDPFGLGRVVLDPATGDVLRVVEEQDADDSTKKLTLVNVGPCSYDGEWLWPTAAALPPVPNGEIYLTDLVAAAAAQRRVVTPVFPAEPVKMVGINTREQMAKAEGILRARIRSKWMAEGVTMPDPATVYIDAEATIGRDTEILPNTHIRGATSIGEECAIGPNTIVDASHIGNRCTVTASMIEHSTIEDDVDVGPFSHVRPGCRIERDVHIGNFVEVNRSRFGPMSRAGHFGYIGDAEIGEDVNIGAGVVFANYDGRDKHVSRIGDRSFVGCDTVIVSPVTMGADAATGAGAVVTHDVPPDTLAKGVPARHFPKKHRPKTAGE